MVMSNSEMIEAFLRIGSKVHEDALAEATGVKSDPVNHPSHYTSDPSGVECIEITRHLNFNIGNAFKYVFRAGSKRLSYQDADMAAIEDLEKAIWYIRDESSMRSGPWGVPDRRVLRSMEKVINSRDGEVRAFFGAVYNLYIGMGADGSQLALARGAITNHIAYLKTQQ